MALTEQDLTDLEIADSVGDLGRNSKVSDAVEEIRAWRKAAAELRTMCHDAPGDLASQGLAARVLVVLAGVDPDGVP